MSELPVNDGPVDADGAEPDGTATFTFAPATISAESTDSAIDRSSGPEEPTIYGWPREIEFLLRFIQQVDTNPVQEKADSFMALSFMAVTSRQRFETEGGVEHLDQAIALAQEAEEYGRDASSETRKMWPALLADLLLQRFQYSQSRKDLEELGRQYRAYLCVYDDDAVGQGHYASMVCSKLKNSWERLMMRGMLDEALFFAQIAEDAPSDGDLHLARRLQAHAELLFRKGYSGDNRAILKKALAKFEQVILLEPTDEDRAKAKSLAAMIRLRLSSVRGPIADGDTLDDYIRGNDILSRIIHVQFALDTGRSHMESFPANLNAARQSLADGQEIIKEILESGILTQTQNEIQILFMAGRISEAYEEALQGEPGLRLEDAEHYWERCWNLKSGVIHYRLRAIHRLSCRLFRQGKFEAAWSRFQLALALIPIVCPQQFEVEDKAGLIQSLEEVSIDACVTALALGKVDAALEVFEAGRGLLLGDFDKTSKDLDRLEQQQPVLFHKFQSVRTSFLYGRPYGCPASPTDWHRRDATNRDASPDEGTSSEVVDTSMDDDATSGEAKEKIQHTIEEDEKDDAAANTDSDSIAGSERSEEFKSVSDDDNGSEGCEKSPVLSDPLGEVIKEIRSLSGFEDFLASLTAKEIRATARKYPIILLVGSILHQDAIILSKDKVEHIDFKEAVDPEDFIAPTELRLASRKVMSIITSDEHERDFTVRNEYLGIMLRQLWNGVAGPIVDRLGFEKLHEPPTGMSVLKNSFKRHIIWLRAGDFHRLPIDSARDASTNPPMPFRAYATHSFTSSFRALLAARARPEAFVKGEVIGSMISMPPRSHGSHNREQVSDPRSSRSQGIWIRNAYEECSRVQKASPEIQWKVLERPSPQEVQEHSSKSHLLHIVCHGVSLPDRPMQSYLQLWDQSASDNQGRPARLTVSQISQWTTTGVYTAFLSACSTADAAKPALYEENVDICNALHLAGVCDVIGSMWPVPDKISVVVAEAFWGFYNHFRPDRSGSSNSRVVASALNVALMAALLENPSEVLNWAGFIHVGGNFMCEPEEEDQEDEAAEGASLDEGEAETRSDDGPED